jgi:ethanolamine utilization protein EutN
MQTAQVIGTATATVRHASLAGCKLLVVQPLQIDGATPDGEPQLAIDRLGAGLGDNVVITSDGKFTRNLLNSDTTPVRWSVIGISDPLSNGARRKNAS